MSNEVHDNHGQTPAAWTAVTIIMVAFVVGCVAVVIAQPWLFWVAVAFCGVGVLVGKVMSMRGYGAKTEGADEPASVEQG